MIRSRRLLRFQSLFAAVIIASIFVLPSAQAQDDTTWYWRKGDDADSVRRTREELDSLLDLPALWMTDNNLGEKLNLRGEVLAGAHLAGADLLGAELGAADLDSADMSNVLLKGAIFEPRSLPDIPSIAQAYGLKEMRYVDNPTALTQLREEFSKAGFKQQERDIIYALRRHNPHFLETILFDWTSEYGSNLSRPWYIFIAIWFLCAAAYYSSMVKRGNKNLRIAIDKSDKEYSGHDDLMISETDFRKIWTCVNLYSVTFRNNFKGYGKVPIKICLIWWAFFFSSISAFNIGFRDVNFGRWLRLLTRKDFDVNPVGWFRVVSGLQALFSVCLVGLWILSFAGTPFK